MKGKARLILDIELKETCLKKHYGVSQRKISTNTMKESSATWLDLSPFELVVANKMLDAQLEELRGQGVQQALFPRDVA